MGFRTNLFNEHSLWESRRHDYNDKERTTFLKELRDLYVLLVSQSPRPASRLSLNQALGLGATGNLKMTSTCFRVRSRRAWEVGMDCSRKVPKRSRELVEYLSASEGVFLHGEL